MEAIDYTFFYDSNELREHVVNFIWQNNYRSEHNSPTEDFGMNLQIKNELQVLGENKFLFLVTLPDTANTTEAYYIGVYAQFEEFDNEPRYILKDKRYFTLEYHDGSIVCFCEWKETNHLLRGNDEDTSLEGFVDMVKKVVK